jgi:hypothetical protein
MSHPADDRPDPQLMAIYAKMSVAKKLSLLDGLIDGARAISAAGVRRQDPDWSEHQVRAEVSRRLASATR